MVSDNLLDLQEFRSLNFLYINRSALTHLMVLVSAKETLLRERLEWWLLSMATRGFLPGDSFRICKKSASSVSGTVYDKANFNNLIHGVTAQVRELLSVSNNFRVC